MKSAFMGIDTGVSGSAALWTEDNNLWLHDWVDCQTADKIIKAWNSKFKIILAAVKMPNAGFGRRQNFGSWEAILEINHVRMIFQESNVWDAFPYAYNLAARKKFINSCFKDFPGAENWISKINNNRRAEALLLARYAYQQAIGEGIKYVSKNKN